MIRPIPSAHGVGFCSMEQLPQYAGKYREEQVGRYWNYYVTPECQDWPENVTYKEPYVIDGFSPNLNKTLHVGHLRQLALAKSLSFIFRHNSRFVALLGASQGVYQYALDELNEWFDFTGYNPSIHYDVLMPRDQTIVPRRKAMVADKSGVESEVETWYGPKGEVIVVRSDGRPTYAFYDISFANTVKPTHYITGSEQKEHFESINLGDKHLSMGLVLGVDGKKMKSRTGDSFTAQEALDMVISQFDPTSEPKKLAWNVLAWNFLHVARDKNVKFTPVEWTKPESPGMYITYTHARIQSTFKDEKNPPLVHPSDIRLWGDEYDADPQYNLTQSDADLIGFAKQRVYAMQRAIDSLDPAMLANYTYDLAVKLNMAYHSEKIKDGRYAFKYAVREAFASLRSGMWNLGMFTLENV